MNNILSTTSKPHISTDNFIGRKTEIDSLVQSLSTQSLNHQATGNIAVISGATGLGKTELALIIAKHLQEEFPDGQLIISFDKDLENKLAVIEILEAIIHFIDPFVLLSDDFNELKTLYSSLLKDKKILIIVDHAVENDQLFFLTPPMNSALLITSRNPIKIHSAFKLKLTALEEKDANKFISILCPKAEPHSSILAQLCHFHPLALRLCAGLLSNSHNLTTEKLISALKNYNDKETSKPSSFSDLLNFLITQIYHLLDVDTQQTFHKLAVFTGAFSQSTVSGLFENQNITKNVTQQLERLSTLDLLNFNESKYFYEMHDVVRLFALEHLDNSYDVHLHTARYCAELIEDLADISLRGSDGVHLSLVLFDDHKIYIKQSWKWLLKQDATSPIINSLFLKHYKVVEAFGRLRFLPKNELIPKTKRALEAAEQLNDHENSSLISKKLADTYKNMKNP